MENLDHFASTDISATSAIPISPAVSIASVSMSTVIPAAAAAAKLNQHALAIPKKKDRKSWIWKSGHGTEHWDPKHSVWKWVCVRCKLFLQ